MERICKYCVWWKENSGKYNRAGFGECSDPHFVYTGMGDEAPINGLEYWDYESYQAGFQTGSEFGCIHFVKNEKIIEVPKTVSEQDKIDPDELEIL